MNYIPVFLGMLILITNLCNLGRPSSFLFAFHIIYKASLLTKMFLKNRNFSWRLENSGPGFFNCVCIMCRQPRNTMLWRFLLEMNLCSYGFTCWLENMYSKLLMKNLQTKVPVWTKTCTCVTQNTAESQGNRHNPSQVTERNNSYEWCDYAAVWV